MVAVAGAAKLLVEVASLLRDIIVHLAADSFTGAVRGSDLAGPDPGAREEREGRAVLSKSGRAGRSKACRQHKISNASHDPSGKSLHGNTASVVCAKKTCTP